MNNEHPHFLSFPVLTDNKTSEELPFIHIPLNEITFKKIKETILIVDIA